MKSLNRLSLLILALALLIPCIGCTGYLPVQQESFRFIVAADPQLFRGKVEDLDKGIKLINNFEPEFVVMCGDLIEIPSNQEQIKAYKDSVSKLSPQIALYNLAGNHDLGRPFKIENTLTYQKNFGKLWYHFTHGSNLFIVLSSDILQVADAPMNKQQMDWLKSTLKQYQSTAMNNKFIFMHHPIYLKSSDEKDAYGNMPDKIRKELLGLFVEHNVRAVFSGHHHDNKINKYQDIDLITTNSITVPLGKTPAGFRIVDVNPDGYKHTYLTIEQLDKQERIK